MKVTFLQHSGFLVEIGDSAFLFDYYRGVLPDVSKHQKLYVFVSHSHYDHYNSDIFLLHDKVRNVCYILSDDIILNKADIEADLHVNIENLQIRRVVPNEDFTFHDCEVRTLMSTDEGVAFIVSYEGKTIYHAGDLNRWVFPLQEAQRNEWVGNVYMNEIDSLENMSFDAAFVPVDPTLQDGFYLGLDYFMKHTNTKYVFPMHFWGNFGIYKRLLALPETKSYADRIVNITRYGEEWVID